ncbi:MAG: type II toxin-antitoxin system RelE/ParE family toxin [Weeksellaceae bacterium]|nr:type II toxin-antitoxin system RelE/ParE family toxin [Bacteroidota bacterium]MCG2781476.1 type II toxin-antitoxin system RelE/ParE family toxin [Weeksellaceae bacterium]
MEYKISNEAANDLEKIWLYTVDIWSTEQADHYLNLIMDEIEYIAEHPKSGKDYHEIRKGYFRTRVKSHFIFYKINLKKAEVEIIRILHQQMDVESRLDD